MTKIRIKKGTHSGKEAIVSRKEREDIGPGLKYELTDLDGNKIWNGQFSFFPESFISI